MDKVFSNTSGSGLNRYLNICHNTHSICLYDEVLLFDRFSQGHFACESECIHMKPLLLLLVEHFHGCVPRSLMSFSAFVVSNLRRFSYTNLIYGCNPAPNRVLHLTPLPLVGPGGDSPLRMKIPNSFPGSVSCNYQNRIYPVTEI